jgi:hypothetical protein
MMTLKIIKWTVFIGLLLICLTGCGQQHIDPSSSATPLPLPIIMTASNTAITPIVIPSQTPTLVTPSDTPTITPTPEPDGCKEPSNNYERITINNHQLNMRTFEMLEYAASLYGGEIDITGSAITQGSYTRAVEASFGTHAGGGAVDLSVLAPGTWTILEEDIEPLIRALRLAGFAAWYRDFDDLYPGSPVHIHAIAIGDLELSLAAREQLAGPHGYFWGYDGLPTDGGKPTRDPHGGPIVCNWMVERGYPNKTATPPP